MAKGKLVFAAAAIAAASLSAFAGTSQAVTFVEGPTDAGQTLTGARDATGTANVTGFSGTIGFAQDADVYKFTVATGGSYIFSTNNAGTATNLDTAIFLFNGAGGALLTNDDLNGTSVASGFTVSLTAGTYYFGISLSGNEPVNSVNQLLFAPYPGGDTTATRGAAANVNPTTLANFDSFSYSTDVGAYNVTIAAVPEPSTWAVVAASTAALAFLRRRRVA